MVCVFPSGEYLFTVMDGYSKFPEIEILRCTKVGTLIKCMKMIFARLGYPEKSVIVRLSLEV